MVFSLNMGHAVVQLVEALRHKPEGHRSDFQWGVTGFFIDLILLATLWPWGQLSLFTEKSTRNISWGVE